MANVKFLKGTQEKFNTLSSFTDGAFYLTTDTDRLYFAQSSTECVPLNQFIRTVTKTQFEALTSAQVSQGDYYYITDQNILAIADYDEGSLKWTQLNPDTNTNTTFDEINFESSVTDNTVTITEKLKEYNAITGKQTGNALAGDLKLKGTNGVALTAENDSVGSTTVTIEGDTYSLSSNMNDARQYEASVAYHVGDIVVINGKYQRCKAEVAAGSNTSAAAIIGSFEKLNAGISLVSANGQASSTFGFKKGANVDIGQTDGQITISAVDTTLTGGSLNISNNAAQGFDIEVSDSGNNKVSGTLNPVIKVGSSSVNFVNGKADLPVYTTSEIDSKFKGLNGMTYKGTVGGAVANLPSSNVSSGDTYMVATASFEAGSIKAKNGDLLIAVGEEGVDGYIPSNGIIWTHVPSGDDSFENSTYKGVATPASNTWGVKEVSGDQLVGDIQFVAGTNMSISSTLGGPDKNDPTSIITTIQHGSVGTASVTSTTNATPQENPDVTNFTAVTGIGRDSNGHVASVTTKQFNIKDTTYTFGTGVENNKIVTKLTDNTNAGEQAVTYGVTSSSLNVTTSAAAANDVTVNVELEWGSF